MKLGLAPLRDKTERERENEEQVKQAKVVQEAKEKELETERIRIALAECVIRICVRTSYRLDCGPLTARRPTV